MERLTEKHYDGKGYFMKCSEACANDDEMCGGCPQLEKIIDRLAAYEDTGLMPEEVAAQRWIPVSEGLPEVGRSVIVYNAPAKCASEAVYKGEGKFLQFRWAARLQEQEVTHWMPLPMPPEEA